MGWKEKRFLKKSEISDYTDAVVSERSERSNLIEVPLFARNDPLGQITQIFIVETIGVIFL